MRRATIEYICNRCKTTMLPVGTATKEEGPEKGLAIHLIGVQGGAFEGIVTGHLCAACVQALRDWMRPGFLCGNVRIRYLSTASESDIDWPGPDATIPTANLL